MKRFLIAILLIFIFSFGWAVDFTPGTLTLDNSAYEKTVCFDAGSGVISHTGKDVSGGFGQLIISWKTDEEKWEKSEDGVNFSTVSLSGAVLNNITKKTWIRKYVKVIGTYATTLGGPWGFTKSGYTNIVIISPRIKLDGGTIGSNQIICYGSPALTINNIISPTGGEKQYNYSWEKSESGNWATISGASGDSYSPGTLTTSTSFRRVVTNICGTVYSNTVNINVHPVLKAPTASANQTICYNTIPAALNGVKATGGGETFTYIWQESNNNSTWNDVTSSLNKLIFSPPALTQTKYYRLKATSSAGCGTLYSNVVTITVYGKLTAGTIGSNQTIFFNTKPSALNSTSLPKGGTGTYTYQWQYSTDNKVFYNLSNATGTSFSPGILAQTTYYRRQETSSGGCGLVYSNTITVNVYNDLNAGIIGSDQDICYGATPVSLTGETPSGSNGNYSYQWEQSTNGVSWNSIPNGKSKNFQPGPLYQTYYFRRVVTCLPDVTKKYSNEIVITVRQPLTAGVIGNAQTICYNTIPVTLVGSTPAGGMESYTYQWYWSENNVDWQPIAQQNNDIYSPSQLIKNSYYKRVVTSGNCGTSESNVVLISVLPNIEGGEIGNDQQIFYNTKPQQLIGDNPQGGTGMYQYKWQYSEDNIIFNDIVGATGTSYSPGNLTKTAYYRRLVTSGSCGTVHSNTVTIGVYEELNAGSIGDNQEICNGATPVALLGNHATGGNGNYLYQWERSSDGATWNAIADGKLQNYQPGALTQSYYYRRYVTTPPDATKKYTNEIVISVKAPLTPGIIGNDQTICYNTAPVTLSGTSATGGAGDYGYIWYLSENSVDWRPIDEQNNSMYSPQQLIKDSYYKRVVTSGSCGTRESNVVLISVLPDIVAGSIGNTQEICFNTRPEQLTGTTPQGGSGNYTYKWQKSLNQVDFEDISLSTNSFYSPSELTQTTYFRRVVTSGSCGTKFSGPIEIKVLNELNPGIISTQKSTICYNSVPVIFEGTLPLGGTGNYQYNWKMSENGVNWEDAPFATGQNYKEKKSLTKNTYYKRLTTSDHCGTKESNILIITVLEQLLPPLIDIAPTYCKGMDISFTIKNFNPKLTYLWNTSGKENTSESYSVRNLNNSFSFSVHSKYDTMCISNKSFYTVKMDSVKADFSCDVTQVEQGGAILFKNKSLYAKSYQWFFDNDGTSGRENPWFYFHEQGLKSITLVATSSGACSDTLTKKNLIIVGGNTSGLNLGEGDLSYLIYPNPFKEILNFKIPHYGDTTFFKITDSLGKVITYGKVTDNTTSVNTFNLKSGIYFLSIINNKEIRTIKIIRQ